MFAKYILQSLPAWVAEPLIGPSPDWRATQPERAGDGRRNMDNIEEYRQLSQKTLSCID